MGSSEWGTTRRLPAQVVFADEVHLGGDLHLLARTTYPPGPETPLEMLNRPEVFFALTLADGGVSFIAKAQVVVVSCHDPLAVPDPDRASVARDVELVVELHGGAEYRGHAIFELPPFRARALDYVNGPGDFFALWDDGLTRYINKSFVRLIRPLD